MLNIKTFAADADVNELADRVLQQVYACDTDRHAFALMLSHPALCHALNIKQADFPVLLLFHDDMRRRDMNAISL